MKLPSFLGIICAVFLVTNVEKSISFRITQPDGLGQRKVTWAKVLDFSGETKSPDHLLGTHPHRTYAARGSGYRPSDAIAKRSDRIHNYQNHHISSRQLNSTVTSAPNNGLGQLNSAVTSSPNNGLQKRALDLLYHKFVEPRIHKNIESRPSLIEELIQTFENHVQKDLAAWSRATPHHSHGGNAIQGSYSPKPEPTYPDVKKPIEEITSVAGVEQGANEDTFVVTDDTGVTHVVSVDDIINSLAQMDEGEISKLLIGTPIEPIGTPVAPIGTPVEKIERRSSNIINGDIYEPQEIKAIEDLSLKHNTFQLPAKRHVPEKVEYSPYVDENEVILIKSEDGDTRLVTRKDVMLAAVASEKKASTTSLPSHKEILTASPVNKSNAKVDTLGVNSKSPFLSLEDVAKLHVASDYPIYIQSSEQSKRSPSVESNSVGSQFQQHLTNQPAGLNGLDSIRESLAEMRRQQQKEKEVLLPVAIPPTFQNSAPNSPPVQIINSPAPGTDNYLLQSPITIQQLQPHTRLSSDSGIRDRFSNFFSRLIGKKVNNVDISHRPKVESDQYVQVVMPNQNSGGMEQVTIPLPKPIHYETRHTRSTTSVERKSRSAPTRPDYFRSRSNIDTTEEHIDAATAQLILNSAKVPKSIHQSILAQINEKPKYEIPGFPMKDKNISKLQAYTGDITERKDSFSHVGYTYDLPPITVEDPYYGGGYESYGYAPAPHYEPHHSPPSYGGHGGAHTNQVVIEHDLYEENQPLIDINLLADLKYLSKVGYQDESFSFPRVGDGSKFVDTRQKYYY